MNINCLKNAERALLTLKCLYLGYGYGEYKLSKFEEYGVYADNLDFLTSQKLVSFTSPNGKLLALRPDVTISIVKNAHLMSKPLEKLFYNENVYRVSKDTNEIKEINQIGIEQLGAIDIYSKAEIVELALKSLNILSPDYMLELSHVGFIDAFFDSFGVMNKKLKAELSKLLYAKNTHDLERLKDKYQISQEDCERFKTLVGISGRADRELKNLKELANEQKTKAAISEIESILSEISCGANRVQLDFSVKCAQNYYNGLVLSGYISGVPRAVLSGGQYDRLIEKFSKGAGAMGFAIYLGELENLIEGLKTSPDALILYGDDIKGLFFAADKLRESGARVLCAKTMPEGEKFEKVFKYENGSLTEVTND